MTLKLSKVRGSDQFAFTYDNGSKVVVWQVNGDDVSTETLTDVVDTVHPALPPTVPMYQVGTQLNPQFVAPVAPRHDNLGAEAADKAAREEEQRLMNMGSALAKGINLGPGDIPVFDNGELPDVNWGA